MSRLTGKVAIVTGASKGIGAGIAKSLAQAGASVVVNYASSKEGADRVVSEIKSTGGKAVAVQADTSKASDVKRLFAETKKAFGQLDVLVNNAGVFRFQPIEEVTEEQFHFHYNINVLGPVLATQEAMKYFSPAGGSIINVSSVVSSNPVRHGVVYSSTKGALDNLTRGLAIELAPRKIRVNAVNPGATETEGAVGTGIFESEMGKQLIAGTPLGRLGQPDDIAKVVTFLASDDAAWVTGETIRAAGGMR
jgi:3-oxoacyl-[acyl-carrier protein] reductase